MSRSIAVEQNLTPVIQYLSEKGCRVESINPSSEFEKNIDQYSALVVTGMNKDFLGVQDIASKIPVIDAKGLTAEQVYSQVIKSLQH